MLHEELRIGNWFEGKQLGSKPTILQVENILGFEVNADFYASEVQSAWEAMPIALTEEWLVKFEFVKTQAQIGNDAIQDAYSKDSVLMLPHHDYFYYAVIYGNPLPFDRTIYVHQLQNLYFALTGKELA